MRVIRVVDSIHYCVSLGGLGLEELRGVEDGTVGFQWILGIPGPKWVGGLIYRDGGHRTWDFLGLEEKP